jgi:hypothetical protein
MKTSFKLALAALLFGGLFGSLLKAGQWSLHYYSPTDGPSVITTVTIPAAGTVSISSSTYLNWQVEGGGYPWISLEIAVEGPGYVKVHQKHEPFGSPYYYEYGTPEAGEYYIEVSASTNPGSRIEAQIDIVW